MFVRVFFILACLSALARADVLVDRVAASGYSVPGRDFAAQVVAVALEVQTPQVPAALLLAMADIESDFDPTSTSRLIDGARKTGPWRSTRAPRGASGNFYCGITQVKASTWKECLRSRDIKVSLSKTVDELTYWLGRAKSMQRALQGYGCGNKGMDGACRKYANRVLRRARWFAQQPKRRDM
jgi:hypothetical protein